MGRHLDIIVTVETRVQVQTVALIQDSAAELNHLLHLQHRDTQSTVSLEQPITVEIEQQLTLNVCHDVTSGACYLVNVCLQVSEVGSQVAQSTQILRQNSQQHLVQPAARQHTTHTNVLQGATHS